MTPQQQEICHLYNWGKMSTTNIAKKLKCSPMTVLKALKAGGIPLRKTKGRFKWPGGDNVTGR